MLRLHDLWKSEITTETELSTHQRGTMEAVVFNGPWRIDIERRPKPALAEPTDAIVKVTTAGICGSELHMYRGHQKSATGHIMVSSFARCPLLSAGQRNFMSEPEPEH